MRHVRTFTQLVYQIGLILSAICPSVIKLLDHVITNTSSYAYPSNSAHTNYLGECDLTEACNGLPRYLLCSSRIIILFWYVQQHL